MSVFQTLSLMVGFGMLIIALINLMVMLGMLIINLLAYIHNQK